MTVRKSVDKVEIKIHHGNIRVFINKILHISVRIEEVVGMTSYIVDKIYYIEIYTTSNTVESNYIDIKLWKRILKEFAKLKII